MTDEEPLTPEEQHLLKSISDEMNYPQPEEKITIFSIFKKIIDTFDTSKVGNLDENELFAVRQLQHLALFCGKLNYSELDEYFRKKGEVVLATSLSKKGAIIEALVTQKRHLLSS